VCTITGWEGYSEIVTQHRVPVVVTGFEPLDLLVGILATVKQLEAGEAKIENCYSRAVTEQGNEGAREDLCEVFEIVDREWRGLGQLPRSGYALRDDFDRFDARRLLTAELPEVPDGAPCISGEILRGVKRPVDCPAFGRTCTPDTPLGAPMVSSEGACAAYFRYHRDHDASSSGESS
jgi:hydrogenase expression/formation protein HypD